MATGKRESSSQRAPRISVETAPRNSVETETSSVSTELRLINDLWGNGVLGEGKGGMQNNVVSFPPNDYMPIIPVGVKLDLTRSFTLNLRPIYHSISLHVL